VFMCRECGRKFTGVNAAEKAHNNGCPKCGGSDIDLAPVSTILPLVENILAVLRQENAASPLTAISITRVCKQSGFSRLHVSDALKLCVASGLVKDTAAEDQPEGVYCYYLTPSGSRVSS
jgi:predicted amidohydrolase YtcJ